MNIPFWGESDWLEALLLLGFGITLVFLLIVLGMAIFYQTRPCHQMKYLRTEHVPLMMTFIMSGKVMVPITHPAHDEEIYRCIEGYEVTR